MREIVCFIIVLLVFAFIIYTRFANIDMTEMRLFLTYWKEYIACFVAAVIALIILETS